VGTIRASASPIVSADGRWRGAIDVLRARLPSAHTRRLTLLLLAMALMGIADLQCTLTYMCGVGMIELNPLARSMVEIAGAQQLVVFKVFTIVLSCGALYLARRDRRAEWCAWLCSAMLLGVCVHWTLYNREVSALTNEIALLAQQSGARAPEMPLGDDSRRQWIRLPAN